MQLLVTDNESKNWYQIIKRIIFVVQFLGKQNLALHGKNNKLDNCNNGSFFKYIEMLEKFDPFLLEHMRRVANDPDFKNMSSSLRYRIQNEVLTLLA